MYSGSAIRGFFLPHPAHSTCPPDLEAARGAHSSPVRCECVEVVARGRRPDLTDLASRRSLATRRTLGDARRKFKSIDVTRATDVFAQVSKRRRLRGAPWCAKIRRRLLVAGRGGRVDAGRVRRGRPRCLCGAGEPVGQHGGGGLPREPWIGAFEPERQTFESPCPPRDGRHESVVGRERGHGSRARRAVPGWTSRRRTRRSASGSPGPGGARRSRRSRRGGR